MKKEFAPDLMTIPIMIILTFLIGAPYDNWWTTLKIGMLISLGIFLDRVFKR